MLTIRLVLHFIYWFSASAVEDPACQGLFFSTNFHHWRPHLLVLTQGPLFLLSPFLSKCILCLLSTGVVLIPTGCLGCLFVCFLIHSQLPPPHSPPLFFSVTYWPGESTLYQALHTLYTCLESREGQQQPVHQRKMSSLRNTLIIIISNV